MQITGVDVLGSLDILVNSPHSLVRINEGFVEMDGVNVELDNYMRIPIARIFKEW